MLFTSLAIAAFASTALAGTTIPIAVGKNGLAFTPNNVNASTGDVLEFTFYAKNHSVTQGSFATPCQVGALTESFFSGFMPTSSQSPTTFSVTVNNTTPLWIFCSQSTGNHCQSGMAMVVNQPAGANTLAAYVAGAAKTNSSEVPFGGKAIGGILSTSASNSTSTGSSTGSSTSSSSTSTNSSKSGANAVVSLLDSMIVGAVAFGAVAFSMAL